MCSLFTGMDDESGILLWLGVLSFEEDFALLLRFMTPGRQDSFDVPQQSGTGDLHRARTEVPRVSYTGDNIASNSSVLNKWFFREIPNSRSCDEFSERLQIFLFTCSSGYESVEEDGK